MIAVDANGGVPQPASGSWTPDCFVGFRHGGSQGGAKGWRERPAGRAVMEGSDTAHVSRQLDATGSDGRRERPAGRLNGSVGGLLVARVNDLERHQHTIGQRRDAVQAVLHGPCVHAYSLGASGIVVVGDRVAAVDLASAQKRSIEGFRHGLCSPFSEASARCPAPM